MKELSSLNLSPNEYLYLGAALLALIIIFFGRRLIWFFFKFDDDVAKILHQQKSSEVRVGRVVESMAPLLDDFPVDVQTPDSSTQFLGQPIDFVHFTPEGEVIFIEVKSGNSQLSASQKRIKKAIQDGKVSFVEYRVKGN